LEARKGFRIFTQIKNQVMDQKEQMQLLDELMSTIQIMDELYRYHPENPNPSRCGIRIQGVGRTQSRNRSQTGSIRCKRRS
jgi:hypothetical protein